MDVPGFNGVVDIYHHNTISSVAKMKQDGVIAVVHKATEGRDYRDERYPERKHQFKSAGFKWGGYHFSSGANPLLQVENFLQYAAPEPDELICLDYEPSSSGANMTYGQMIEFINLIHQEIGRYPVVYGGHLLREAVKDVTNSILSNCPLWYARYASAPYGIPSIWQTWTLWQYTDGNAGPLKPHTVEGIGHCDRDTFNGTQQELLQRWPFS